MKYLLDTNIIINHLRGKKKIDASFFKKGSAISIITKAELFYGAYKSSRPKNNLQSIKNMINDLSIRVVNLNEEIINIYGKTKAKLEKAGSKLDEFDLLIASTALGLNLQLATENKKHFKRISGLKLI